MPTRYHLVSVPDAAVVKFFKEICDIAKPGRPTFSSISSLNFTLDENLRVPQEYRDVFGSQTALIYTASYHDPEAGFAVTYRRGHTYQLVQGGGYSWHTNGNFVDGLEVDGPNDPDIAKKLVGAIKRNLVMIPLGAITSSNAGHNDVAEAMLNRVTSAAAELAEHTAARQQELDAYRARLEDQANASLAKHLAEAEKQFEEKFASLQKREKDLNERLASLDDRENTHVRREVKNNLTGEVDRLLGQNLMQKSFTAFSQLTLISLVVGLVLICLAVLSGSLFSGVSDQGALIFLEVSRILLGIGAASCFWFAIRQAGQRYAQVAKWENELHRFRLDAERAAFILEGDLEARKTNSAGLPDVILDRFSRGLFSSDTPTEQSDPVGNTLVHLLNRPAGLEIGTNGIKVEVDKSSLRKSARDIEA